MQRSCILFALLLSGLSTARAQTFEKSIQGNNAQFGTAIQGTSDGGFILAGYTMAFGIGAGTYYNVYLVRTDASGDTLWTRTYGGAGDDQGFAVQQTSDDGFLVAGTTNSFGSAGKEVYLIRTDTNGDLLWSKTYGGPGEETGYGLAITFDDGAIVVGASGSSGGAGGGTNAYVIRTDAAGDTLWTRTIHSVSDNYALSVNEVPGGDHIIAGVGAVGGWQMELYRIDDNGVMVWNKAMTTGYASGYSAIATADGGFMVCGILGSAACLVKTDAAGDTLWSKTYHGVNLDYGYCVLQTTDGGYVFSGEAFSKTWLVRTDAQGDTLWQHTYSSGNAELNEVVLTDDGGFAFCANRFGGPGSGGYAMQLVRTGADGWIPCNMESPVVVVEDVSPTVTSPTLTLASYGQVGTPATLVSSGALIVTPCSTMGISGAGTKDAFGVFPNPAADRCLVSLGAAEVDDIEVINSQGAVLVRVATHGRSLVEMPLDRLAQGTYILRTTGGIAWHARLVVVAR